MLPGLLSESQRDHFEFYCFIFFSNGERSHQWLVFIFLNQYVVTLHMDIVPTAKQISLFKAKLKDYVADYPD